MYYQYSLRQANWLSYGTRFFYGSINDSTDVGIIKIVIRLASFGAYVIYCDHH